MNVCFREPGSKLLFKIMPAFNVPYDFWFKNLFQTEKGENSSCSFLPRRAFYLLKIYLCCALTHYFFFLGLVGVNFALVAANALVSNYYSLSTEATCALRIASDLNQLALFIIYTQRSLSLDDLALLSVLKKLFIKMLFYLTEIYYLRVMCFLKSFLNELLRFFALAFNSLGVSVPI